MANFVTILQHWLSASFITSAESSGCWANSNRLLRHSAICASWKLTDSTIWPNSKIDSFTTRLSSIRLLATWSSWVAKSFLSFSFKSPLITIFPNSPIAWFALSDPVLINSNVRANWTNIVVLLLESIANYGCINYTKVNNKQIIPL